MAPTRPPLHASAAILLELSFGPGYGHALATRIHDRTGGELNPSHNIAQELSKLASSGFIREITGERRALLVSTDLRQMDGWRRHPAAVRYFEITAAGSERVAEIRCCLMKMAGVEPST